jgi:hypothetical protein
VLYIIQIMNIQQQTRRKPVYTNGLNPRGSLPASISANEKGIDPLVRSMPFSIFPYGGEGSIEILIKLADEAYSPMQIAVVDFDAVLVRRNAYNGVPSVLPARGTEPTGFASRLHCMQKSTLPGASACNGGEPWCSKSTIRRYLLKLLFRESANMNYYKTEHINL